MFDYEYKKMTRAEAEMKIGRKHGYASRILTKKDMREIVRGMREIKIAGLEARGVSVRAEQVC